MDLFLKKFNAGQNLSTELYMRPFLCCMTDIITVLNDYGKEKTGFNKSSTVTKFILKMKAVEIM